MKWGPGSLASASSELDNASLFTSPSRSVLSPFLVPPLLSVVAGAPRLLLYLYPKDRPTPYQGISPLSLDPAQFVALLWSLPFAMNSAVERVDLLTLKGSLESFMDLIKVGRPLTTPDAGNHHRPLSRSREVPSSIRTAGGRPRGAARSPRAATWYPDTLQLKGCTIMSQLRCGSECYQREQCSLLMIDPLPNWNEGQGKVRMGREEKVHVRSTS